MSTQSMFSLVEVKTPPWEEKDFGYFVVDVVKNWWFFTVDGKALLYKGFSYQMNSNKAILDHPMNSYLYEIFPNLKIEQIELAYLKHRT